MYPSPSEDPVWVYPHLDSALQKKIEKEFNLNPITAQILVSRGITSFDQIHNFLYAKLPDLHDPSLMTEMPLAIERI